MAGNFKLGPDFPSEQFVQNAVQRWLEGHGFDVSVGQHNPDLLGQRPDGVRWHIEAKGHTSAVGLDFRTGLGQLIQGMHDESATFALAIPSTSQFKAQCGRVPEWVRRSLRVTWLFVASDGTVEVIPPP
jgi:hypothetical protein